MTQAEAKAVLAQEKRRKELAAAATKRWREKNPEAARESDRKQAQRKRARVAEAKKIMGLTK